MPKAERSLIKVAGRSGLQDAGSAAMVLPSRGRSPTHCLAD